MLMCTCSLVQDATCHQAGAPGWVEESLPEAPGAQDASPQQLNPGEQHRLHPQAVLQVDTRLPNPPPTHGERCPLSESTAQAKGCASSPL